MASSLNGDEEHKEEGGQEVAQRRETPGGTPANSYAPAAATIPRREYGSATTTNAASAAASAEGSPLEDAANAIAIANTTATAIDGSSEMTVAISSNAPPPLPTTTISNEQLLGSKQVESTKEKNTRDNDGDSVVATNGTTRRRNLPSPAGVARAPSDPVDSDSDDKNYNELDMLEVVRAREQDKDGIDGGYPDRGDGSVDSKKDAICYSSKQATDEIQSLSSSTLVDLSMAKLHSPTQPELSQQVVTAKETKHDAGIDDVVDVMTTVAGRAIEAREALLEEEAEEQLLRRRQQQQQWLLQQQGLLAPLTAPQLARGRIVAQEVLPGAVAVQGDLRQVSTATIQLGGNLYDSDTADQPGDTVNTSNHQERTVDNERGLVEAMPVNSDSTMFLMEAEQVDEEEEAAAANKRHQELIKKTMGALACGIIIVVIITIVVVLLATRDNNELVNETMSSPTFVASTGPTTAPTFDTIENRILALLPDYTLEAMLEQSVNASKVSPQMQALGFLLSDRHPSLANFTDWRIQQRFALATFYYATGGGLPDIWEDQDNWLLYNEHECHWKFKPDLFGFGDPGRGIINISSNGPCDVEHSIELDAATGRINHLWLWGINLVGTLPAEIGMLRHLQTINLDPKEGDFSLVPDPNVPGGKILKTQDTWLTGSIPKELVLCTDLTVLSIQANTLTSSLPLELTALTNLVYLRLPYNLLTGTLASELGLLTQMRTLKLTSLYLTGTVPTELALMTSLQELDLASTPFNSSLSGTFPSELGLMPHLQMLDLSLNALTGIIPAVLALMPSLTRLDLSYNGLTGTLPTEIAHLTFLQELDLSRNDFSGTLPIELASLASLEKLDLSGLDFTGTVPTELALMKSLKILHLGKNYGLNGTIPTKLASLISLESLDISSNALTGTVPSELVLLASLLELDLSGNDIMGTVPSMTSLEVLDLASNELTGTFPVELTAMSLLKILCLEFNALTGTIPSGLALMTSLESLELSFNAHTGALPTGLTLMTSLKDLKLMFMGLTGAVPSELALMTSLEDLELSNNNLTGTFPSELALMASLQELHLDYNNFTGALPSELALMSSLSWLDISGNDFTGPVPPFELAMMPVLWRMDLAGTALTGTLPPSICSLGQSHFLFDCSSTLCGCDWCPCPVPTISPQPTSSPAPSISPTISLNPTSSPTAIPTINCPQGTPLFLLVLLTDSYPEETSWNVVDSHDILVVSNNGESYQNSTEHVEMECLAMNRTYTFTINDSFNDGICCSGGHGSYVLYLDGKELKRGGDFFSFETTMFFTG